MVPSWREQYDRMTRWWSRLHEPGPIDERRRDDYYTFFVTCFHLKDWLKNDPSVPKPTRDQVENFVDRRPSLRACADIANGVKHLVRTKEKVVRFDPDTRLVINPPAFQEGAFQRGAFQTGGIAIDALGQKWDAETVAGRCVLQWVNFLKQEGLLTEPGDSD
jgi:hypothetical protein